MKHSEMRAPVASELYQQKLLYQSHLRKLEKIREERKNQLALDSTRLAKQMEFKHAKSRSFAHRYNEHHQEITQSNIKFLHKLEKVRPFTHHSSYSGTPKPERQQQIMTPLRRRRIEETEKENARICVRMRSVSSSLSKDKLLKEYARSQQIKARISRYATQNNRISLKSQQFASSLDKPNLASHYKPHEIIKNNIQNRIKTANEKLSQPLKEVSFFGKPPRKETGEPKREQIVGEKKERGGDGIFATEPPRSWGRKKIYI